MVIAYDTQAYILPVDIYATACVTGAAFFALLTENGINVTSMLQ